MKISIIIPTYNSGETILRCIYSILKQTYTNMEILICDDNSEDNTIKLIEKIKDERIKLIKNDVHRGVVFSRNKLIKLSIGDLITLLDSDDTIDSMRNEFFVKEFSKKPEMNICGSNYNIVYKEKNIRKSNLPLDNKSIRKHGVHKSILGASICFRNKSEITKYKYRDFFNKKSCEDIDYILRISEENKIYNINYHLYNYHYTKQKVVYKIANFQAFKYLYE